MERDPIREQIDALPPDLAERVGVSLSLDEAETIAAERARRVTAWIERMRLTDPGPEVSLEERAELRAVLQALDPQAFVLDPIEGEAEH